ncbi:MAG: hypothetical protein ACTS6P_00980 [Candidatus Hodgkinia cicadicola]
MREEISEMSVGVWAVFARLRPNPAATARKEERRKLVNLEMFTSEGMNTTCSEFVRRTSDNDSNLTQCSMERGWLVRRRAEAQIDIGLESSPPERENREIIRRKDEIIGKI